jgi:hypothetical protein
LSGHIAILAENKKWELPRPGCFGVFFCSFSLLRSEKEQKNTPKHPLG